MSTFFETGHAKNVANLLKLNQQIATYGLTYNPSNNAIKATVLATLYNTANTKLTTVNNLFTTWKNATNARELAFDPLAKQATQILASLQSLGIAQQTIDDFAFQTQKFRSSGSKLTKADAGIIEDPNADTANKTTLPVKKTVSVSQQSFDNLIEHYDKIIKLLASVPAYNPTETALKVATLQTTLANLKTLNTAAYTSAAKVSNARIARNKILYENPDALIVLAKAVKAYIKGKFGASSPEYGQVSSIKFTKVKTGK